MKIRPIISFYMFLLLFFGYGVSADAASEGANFSLKLVHGNTASPAVRGYYLFTAAGNETIPSQVMVVNEGSTAGVAKLYPVMALTGQTGGTVFANRLEAARQAATWITFAEQEISLEAGESKLIAFSIEVPEGARAGHHVAGIAVETADEAGGMTVQRQTETASFQVNVRTRMVMAVQVDIPGERVEEMDVTAVTAGGSGGYQKLFFDMHNKGNVMLKPAGSLVVTDAEGQTVQSLDFQMDTFLPETQIAYPVFVENEALPAGSYTADLTLTYGETVREQSFQLPFEITEAQNEVVFGETRDALAAPPEVVGSAAEPQPALPYWQIFVTGGLGFIDAVLAFTLIGLVYRYMSERRQRLAR